MADGTVEFLLNNLNDLQITDDREEASQLKSHIVNLEKDLGLLKAFLKESEKMKKDEELVQSIRDAVYEVEDVIDAMVSQVVDKRAKNYFDGLWKYPMDLPGIRQMADDLKAKVEQARTCWDNHDDDHPSQEITIQVGREKEWAREKQVVGLQDVMNELIFRLSEETDDLKIVYLIGMSGQGKTTVAWKIFNDPKITFEFRIRIWLSISPTFSEKDIFLAILKEFIIITEDIYNQDALQIGIMVAECLKNERFLIVMDDIWSADDWERLAIALPTNNRRGKVLITSRHDEVAMRDCFRFRREESHRLRLRLFTQDESWELLLLGALGHLECPYELVHVGKQIVSCCNGVPLAIVLIGGILAATTSSSDKSAMREDWEKLSTWLRTQRGNENWINNIYSLSYDKLTYHLRSCFLYLGMFPEDYQICVSKLIRMWIAEGFIQQHDHSCSLDLEETAEIYLADLIRQNLVMVDKLKHDGKVKTCHIHQTLRDFCLAKARNENENFLQEIKFNYGELDKYRRLSIHSNCLDFISSQPNGPRVRSFVCFSKERFILPAENIPHILAAFKLLRVADIEPIAFPKITSGVYQLVHMRYLVLSLNLSALPPKFSQLWNLQTLIVHTTSTTLEVKADIWNMKQLRHFKTNASATLPKPSENTTRDHSQLQTLGTISVASCTTEILVSLWKLKKLGVRGELAVGFLDSLGEMTNLEKLKLINELQDRPASEGRLRRLPQFPPRLKRLTIIATYLSWDQMSVLGFLENLEVLKLKANAFDGPVWRSDRGFRRLEFLHIEAKNLERWMASPHHFPALRGLVLRNCHKLLGIPVELADVASFQRLELDFCKSAAASAKKIHEAKINKRSTFKLSIVPPFERPV